MVMKLKTMWLDRYSTRSLAGLHPMRIYLSRKLVQCLILCLIFVLSGCSRGDVPLPTFLVAETSMIPTEMEPAQTATPLGSEKYPLQVEYAAVWASKEEGLSVRNQAGISATVAEVLPWDSRQIFLTGNRSLLGSSMWLEIRTENNIKGWVSAWNLTENISSNQFCNDSQARTVLEGFIQAMQDPEHARLKEFISPNRGLSIRLNWYSPDVTYSMDDVVSIFTDVREIDWGTMADSGLKITGSFEKVVQPKLEDIFTDLPEALCNELEWGSTAGTVLWPNELENLNFYAFYQPSKEGGNPLDWRTWAIGIEYVNHQPFITILIHYSSEL
jgi:hypothetical protein